MKLSSLKLITTLTLATTLTACSHIPLTTQIKLMGINKSKVNLAIYEYAFQMPNNIKIIKNKFYVEINTKKSEFTDKAKIKLVFNQINTVSKSNHLNNQLKNDYHIKAYGLNGKDKELSKQIFKQSKKIAIAKLDPNIFSSVLTFKLCPPDNIKYKDARLNLYVKMNGKDDFFTMFQNATLFDIIYNGKPPKELAEKYLRKCK